MNKINDYMQFIDKIPFKWVRIFIESCSSFDPYPPPLSVVHQSYM